MKKHRNQSNPTVAMAVVACLAVLQISRTSKREYESALLGTEGLIAARLPPDLPLRSRNTAAFASTG